MLRRMHDDAGGFDIVIDDGSHINDHVIASFETLFPLLKDGGLYVVEDAQTSYWPILGGSSTDPDSTRTIIGYFKSLIHGLNHAEIDPASYLPSPFDHSIVSLAFYHGMVFIEKGDNSEPSNVPPSDPLRRA
jgi:demethylmacrocin O-methyltransferase